MKKKKDKTRNLLVGIGFFVMLAGIIAFIIGYNIGEGMTILIGAFAVAFGFVLMIPINGDGGETITDGM